MSLKGRVAEPERAERVPRSRVFPGLRLAVGALLNGDLAGALRVLQAGIDSDEHRRFVARLAETTEDRNA